MPDPPASAGVLYVVATPIGNLEDITLRALRVLREADLIACEDTRHSRKLLEHFQIHRPLLSCYRENEAQRSGEIVARLRAGASVALISDAGSPALADPGARLVAAAIEAGIPVVPVPGASAPTTALMAAGQIEPPIAFLGFLPARAAERRRRLEQWRGFAGTLVVFEAPHRITDALADIESILGPGRPMVVARELTKLHEEFLRGPVADLRSHFAARGPRGEFTLLIGPAPVAVSDPAPLDQRLRALGGDAAGKTALKQLARDTGIPRGELYRRWVKLRHEPPAE